MISILIPSRNEKYLDNTIKDLQEHAETPIEILWEEDEKGEGHRVLTNRLAKKAKGEWLMKIDAHCSFSQGFDKEMLKLADKDLLQAPILCRLEPEHWHIAATPRTICYCFDKDLMFDYWPEREEVDKRELTETLSLQGSCFMCHRDKFFELELCDERIGQWGSQGVEIGLRFWLSGGRVATNRNAYYGHWFRQEMEKIPYKAEEGRGNKSNENLKDLFLNNKWDKAIYKLEDIISRFSPVKHWER